MASAAQIAAAQKLADEMAAAAAAEDSDDAPLESLVTVTNNGAANHNDASGQPHCQLVIRQGAQLSNELHSFMRLITRKSQDEIDHKPSSMLTGPALYQHGIIAQESIPKDTRERI